MQLKTSSLHYITFRNRHIRFVNVIFAQLSSPRNIQPMKRSLFSASLNAPHSFYFDLGRFPFSVYELERKSTFTVFILHTLSCHSNICSLGHRLQAAALLLASIRYAKQRTYITRLSQAKDKTKTTRLIDSPSVSCKCAYLSCYVWLRTYIPCEYNDILL